VSKLDFVSGLGYHPSRTHGAGPKYIVTDLGQFDFANKRMRLISFHPGVSVDHIQKRTGFELDISPDLDETLHPTANELNLLRNKIDPMGIRMLELLSGTARRDKLHEILAKEKLY
jgi:glutaconate CoA-transferase subunit B